MTELKPRIHDECNGLDYVLVGWFIIEQMKQAEGVTETMKADNQMLWVQSMNSIRNRAEEIIRQEMIYC